MNRKDISGFNFNVLGYNIEIVTIKKIPRILAISKPLANTIFTLEV